jgi:hypothetical protein
MTTQASKHQPKGKSKARKLKLNKETLKDLDPNNSAQVKGGAGTRTGQYTCYVRTCP